MRPCTLLFALAVLSGCGDDPTDTDPNALFPQTEATVLTTSSPTKDEDPSLVRGRDGALYVAWFSDRGANPDIYVTHNARGTNWSSPVRVTTSTEGDFAPSLLQDAQGTFHLAWFRWSAPYRGSIWYNTSADGKSWNPANEVRVTNAPNVDDWVPTMAQAPDGSLVVYFISALRDASTRSDIYYTRRPPGSTAWSAVARVPGINSNTEHDHLPFVARTGNTLTLLWERHDSTEALPWLNRKSQLYSATSTDGVSWSAPTRVTNDAGLVVNLFPGLYQRFDGSWWIVWLSTRSGSPRLFELPLANATAYPAGVVENTALGAGYSHRAVQSPTPGVYLGVWVRGADDALDVMYRFYRRD